jgi:hypothetical protein
LRECEERAPERAPKRFRFRPALLWVRFWTQVEKEEGRGWKRRGAKKEDVHSRSPLHGALAFLLRAAAG